MLLSIIVPVFNREEMLHQLLLKLSDSIIRENFENLIEIIVIDDYSKNIINIPEVSCVARLIRNQKNLGAPLSREVGYKLSQGKFIHFHDSDDLISKKWLIEIIRAIKLRPELDILMTGRMDFDETGEVYRLQKYFHNQVSHPQKIKSRLIYRNCMGPLGGVTFSRRVLMKTSFKQLSSCQDWQMYLDAIQYAKVLVSLPETHFIFNKIGGDRISHNPRKKILGHLQLAKLTSKDSAFKNNIKLFYLYSCKQHIYKKGGLILSFYKKNRVKIILTFLVVSLYWRVT